MIINGNDPFTGPSFSLSNRIARVAWIMTWVILGRFSPRPFHGWRAFLLRAFGARIGRGVHVYPKVEIWAPWQLELGDAVGIADGVRIYNIAPVRIGTRGVVSQGAYLCTGSHDIDSPNFQLIAAPITMGANAWVCAEAFVGPGVHIAEWCVIGARAVLTRSAEEPATVWRGNPAAPGRKRTVHLPRGDGAANDPRHR